jgi:hypothetical protein
VLSALIIALAVGFSGLAAPVRLRSARLQGKPTERRSATWGGPQAQAAISRESSTTVPSPRTSVGTMRLPVRLNLRRPRLAVEDAQEQTQALGLDHRWVNAGLRTDTR